MAARAQQSVIIDGTEGSPESSRTESGTTWNIGNDQLVVGYSNVGKLNITDDGSVINGAGQIGLGSEGTVTVDGANSKWVNGGSFYVGYYGAGTLNLNGSAGARGVLATSGVAKGAGNTILNFDGGILRATAYSLDFLSNFAAGDITIHAGSAFIDSDIYNITAAAPLGGDGGLTKTGNGTLTLTAINTNTYTGETDIIGGTLQVDGSGSIASSSLTRVNSGATLDFINGTTAGGGTIFYNSSTAGNARLINNGADSQFSISSTRAAPLATTKSAPAPSRAMASFILNRGAINCWGKAR